VHPPVPPVYTPAPVSSTSAYSNQDMGYSFGPVPPAYHEPPEMPVYRPLAYHWFYRKNDDIWKPYSIADSTALEAAHDSRK